MSAEQFIKKSYDYVIIGGGTAGLVLAARLSEDEAVTVSVLEAGSNRLNDPMIDAPNNFMGLWDKPEYDWAYKTVPQKGLDNRVVYWPRGRCLGGSSTINFNMFSLASKQDLDNWGELGNEGWTFDDLAPYYRKFEHYTPASKDLDAKLGGASKCVDPLLRGTDGPVQEMWPPTCLNAGYPQPQDPRSGSSLGGFNQPLLVDPITMKRSYSARAFYEPNTQRSNLSVLADALVTKIGFEKGEIVKATGVSFKSGGTSFSVKVLKEVIVCGGTINSPQILELSGIGSSDILQENGIEVIVDNPNVGENLCDHSASGISFAVKDEYPTAEVLLRNPEIAQQAFMGWMEHKAGPLANAPTTVAFLPITTLVPDTTPVELKARVDSLVSTHQAAHPETSVSRTALITRQLFSPGEAAVQLLFFAVGLDRYHSSAAGLFNHSAPGNWVSMVGCSTHSLSRGSIHIKSSDPATPPAIDPAYFSHPLDLEIASQAMLRMVELAKVEPLRSCLKLDEQGNPIVHPEHQAPTTRAEAEAWVRKLTATEYHPAGTCAMLPREKGGVVDSELRVYGTSNVRVVDASVFPTHVQGNIISCVYAVAEKAADIIKAEMK
ncbi:alcohol oxidase [Lophium mytilinum]|uniref:Alcohol oxidase n=1 Tax=Lophium mytilinum TaxID=390894 RepID=A0A6A6QSZ3_9PEZI|nr:alcohol oxidase [Lophium mytilinum]